MARNQTQQTKANTQLAKAGWKDSGDGAYTLGPKPFNSELSEQVLYKVNKLTGNIEVFKFVLATSETKLLASINASTGKITENKENFRTFYNNDKAAHKLLLDSAKAETTKNVSYIIEPETAVILSRTTSSPFKSGLVSLSTEELEEPPPNAGPFFEVVELTSSSSLIGPVPELGTEITSRGNNIKKTTQNDNDADGGDNPPDVSTVKPSESASSTDGNNDGDTSPTSDSERKASLARSSKGGSAKLLAYPEKMTGDRIKFEIVDYQKSGLGGQDGFGIGQASNRTKNVLSTIYLPIQRGYGDTLACNWGEGEINPLTAMAASASYSTIMTAAETGNLGAAAGTFGSALLRGANTLMGGEGNEELKQMVAAYFAAQAVGMQGFLSRTAGAAINNNLELLFQGPTLRSFSFSFRLTPRSKTETETIRRIIKSFKINMAPEASESNLFLLAPRVFDIQYMSTAQEDGATGPLRLHPYMNKLKRCALRDFSVNYSPDGQYMTYKDGGMTAYEIAMTFAELDPVLANDYESVDDETEGMGF